MPGISAVIICKNEEQFIAGAIESVLWADEVLLVDSFSTDSTLQLAGQYPIRILQHAFDGYSRQRNWAIEQTTQPWVLMLDADERIPTELQAELKHLMKNTPAYPAYSIRRKNFFMGRQVRYSGWQNDSVVRLFDKSLCRYSDKQVHEELIVPGQTGKLKHRMLHYTYRDLPHFLAKWDQYSWLSAQDKARKTGKVSFFHLGIKPMVRFLKQYFLKLGILDGRVGFIIAYLAASSVFMRYLKMWRLQEEHQTTK